MVVIFFGGGIALSGWRALKCLTAPATTVGAGCGVDYLSWCVGSGGGGCR